MIMTRLSIIVITFFFISIKSFSQSNYVAFGKYEDVLRYGFILRFEIRDFDTRIPLENANIDLIEGSHEIASVATNRSGVGIFIFKEDIDFPWFGKIRITKSNHCYYEENIERDYLKSQRGRHMIILLNSNNNWSGAPSPSDQEIVDAVNNKNYRIHRDPDILYGGPGIFEYTIYLEQIRNTLYVEDRNANRQNPIEKREDNQEYYDDIALATERAESRRMNLFPNTVWKMTNTVGLKEVIYIKFTDNKHYEVKDAGKPDSRNIIYYYYFEDRILKLPLENTEFEVPREFLGNPGNKLFGTGGKVLQKMGDSEFPTLTDIDGMTYKTVQIGTQTWMAENLKCKTTSNGGGLVYDNKSSNEAIYGRLYRWGVALKACPEGWHLPSYSEWTRLIDYLGGEKSAGGKMKVKSLTFWNTPNTGATNECGFSAFAGGALFGYMAYSDLKKRAYFWSSTEGKSVGHDNNRAVGLTLYFDQEDVFQGTYSKNSGFSVRCLKD